MTPIPRPIITGATDASGVPQARRALFLDRDGVINVNHGYVHTPDRTDWVPGIFDLARAATSAGFVLVVVTNQAGIARGYYTQAQFEAYTRWLHGRFAEEGAPLLATYYCPHHPDAGQGELRVQCDCRKPRPGMLLAAISDWNLDPAGSILVGDQVSDMAAAASAGIGLAMMVRGGGLGAVAAGVLASVSPPLQAQADLERVPE
ncbi:HAD family hydrolase [Pseudoxanthomonas sp. 10H]|uniref:HAD family hydrolase n=1 Tax=Pseudoxanthomonas sp. 10H TaxID=3242729 RepID=UPI003557DB6C